VNVPHLLSLARLPLAVAFLLLDGPIARVAIIAAAAASDYLDGWWARTRGPATRAGALLDPITDKVFVVTALVAFTRDGVLSAAGLLVLIARDVIVIVGAVVVALARLPVRLQARFPGKLVTTLQIIAVLALTVLPIAATPLVVVTAAASAWAVADYGSSAMRALRAQRRLR
jgi:cardiolipin synthase (CMP-forming)